jgi:hypothetical protein
MADSGSAAGSPTQPKHSRKFLSGFKERFSSHQKNKDRGGLPNQQNDRNKAVTTNGQKAPDLGAQGGKGGSPSGPSTHVEETVQSSKSVSTTEPTVISGFPARISPTKSKETIQSPKNVSTIDPTNMSASSPSAEIEKAPQSSKVISAADPLGSIHELWNEAYDELRSQEEKLIKDYEAALHGDPAMMLGSTVILSGFKLERKTQMAALLARKVEEVKKNTWRLKFGGHDVPLKDLAESVLGIVQWADDYISGALSANPYALIAWGGVSLLLPVSTYILTPYRTKRCHLRITFNQVVSGPVQTY